MEDGYCTCGRPEYPGKRVKGALRKHEGTLVYTRATSPESQAGLSQGPALRSPRRVPTSIGCDNPGEATSTMLPAPPSVLYPLCCPAPCHKPPPRLATAPARSNPGADSQKPIGAWLCRSGRPVFLVRPGRTGQGHRRPAQCGPGRACLLAQPAFLPAPSRLRRDYVSQRGLLRRTRPLPGATLCSALVGPVR